MDQKGKKIEFRFGKAGKLAPLIVAALMIGWAAFSQSNVNGYVLAFFAALVTGIIFAKDEKAYGEALVYGLGKPMFGVIGEVSCGRTAHGGLGGIGGRPSGRTYGLQ